MKVFDMLSNIHNKSLKKNNFNKFKDICIELKNLEKRKGIPLFFCVSSNKKLNKFIKKRAMINKLPYVSLEEYSPGTIGNKNLVSINNEETVSINHFDYIVIFNAGDDEEKELYRLCLPILNLNNIKLSRKKIWASVLPLIIKNNGY